MLIRNDPDEYKAVVSSRTCPFHQRHPGEAYAGCTCMSSYGVARRSDEEVAAIKAARRMQEEDDILARAKAIQIARELRDSGSDPQGEDTERG